MSLLEGIIQIMKVIFLQDVKGRGKRFEVREVPDGYALNLLLPKKLALPHTPQNLALIKQMQAHTEAKRHAEEKRLAEKQAKREEKHRALEEFKQAKQR